MELTSDKKNDPKLAYRQGIIDNYIKNSNIKDYTKCHIESNLAKIIRDRQLTHEMIAVGADVPVGSIRGILSDPTGRYFINVYKICSFLGIDITEAFILVPDDEAKAM